MSGTTSLLHIGDLHMDGTDGVISCGWPEHGIEGMQLGTTSNGGHS